MHYFHSKPVKSDVKLKLLGILGKLNLCIFVYINQLNKEITSYRKRLKQHQLDYLLDVEGKKPHKFQMLTFASEVI